MVKACQIRAARAMLSWSQQDLADRAALNRDTVKSAETLGVRTHQASLDAIVQVLEREGLRFSEDTDVVTISLDKRNLSAR